MEQVDLLNKNNADIILNCLLIKNKVRELYIYESECADEKEEDTKLEKIQKLFPELYFEKSSVLNFSNKYDILISNRKLDLIEYDNNLKLGKLLGYPTADHFPIFKTEKESGYYIYHIKVDLIKNSKVVLFSFVAKDISKEKEIRKFLSDIEEGFILEPVYKLITKIYITRIKKTNNQILEISFIN
jgi:hypothetical protein